VISATIFLLAAGKNGGVPAWIAIPILIVIAIAAAMFALSKRNR
jgi:hypothetical protein